MILNVIFQTKIALFFILFPFYTKGILEKNRDTFSADLYHLLGQSTCKFLLHLFDKELKMVGSTLMLYRLKSVLVSSSLLVGLPYSGWPTKVGTRKIQNSKCL